MTFESESRQRARRRRASGALVDFDGKRLSVARRLRRMQRTALAAQTSVTAAAITQYERGGRPTNTVAAELALALGVPIEFFRQGRPLTAVTTGDAHFRSLRATPAISRDQALAFAEIALAVIEVIEQYVDLPQITDIIEQDQVSRTIAELVQNLRNLGLDDHVIAAQLHMKADALSPPELTPRDVVRKSKKAAE